MSTEKRIEKQIVLKQLIENIPINLLNVCLNGIETKFKQSLEYSREIGRGAYGTVYIAEIDGHDFVVKESFIHDAISLTKLLKHGTKRLDKNTYSEEFRIMKILNHEIKSGGCPNFILSYSEAICASCGDEQIKTCYMSFMEPAIGDLSVIKYFSDDIAKSLLFQLLLALFTLHFKYGIHHRDLKANNILVLPVSPGGYFKYIIREKEYYVQNVGYLFCIHDFGISSVYKPSNSSRKIYGTRNAKLSEDGTLIPIICKSGTIFADNKIIISGETIKQKWIDENEQILIATKNVFTDKSIGPTIPVNLNDTIKFPPFEFFNDIQNLLALIVGGTGFVKFDGNTNSKMYSHRKLPGISKSIENLIVQFQIKRFPYYTKSTDFLYVNLILDKVYEKPDVDFVVETFNISGF